jgi:acyl carrier protein
MISDRLKRVIAMHFGIAEVDLRAETKASEVPGWDSLSHVAVLAAVEREYGIRFGGLEVMRLKNIGELQALVDRKMATPR